MAAIRKRKSVDTSMGLTPLEGLVMGTRCGDVDPAIAFFIANTRGMDITEIDETFNKKSGLLGVSGLSSDMREILTAADDGHERAQLALEIFTYRVKKYIGAYAAVLGELDAVVFTGGIGENCDKTRRMSCEGLEIIGVKLDESKNRPGRLDNPDVTTEDSRVKVLVIPTNEELMIARDAVSVVQNAK